MKKLLSILAAVGLTATASTAVVACTTTVKAKNTDNYNGVITTEKAVSIKLDKDYDNLGAISNDYAVFVSDKKDAKKADAFALVDVKDGTKDYTPSWKKDKKYDFNVTFKAEDATKGGTYYLYKLDKDGKKTGKTIEEIKFDKFTTKSAADLTMDITVPKTATDKMTMWNGKASLNQLFLANDQAEQKDDALTKAENKIKSGLGISAWYMGQDGKSGDTSFNNALNLADGKTPSIQSNGTMTSNDLVILGQSADGITNDAVFDLAKQGKTVNFVLAKTFAPTDAGHQNYAATTKVMWVAINFTVAK